MQPYQQRVIDEKAELDERLIRLSAFLCGEIFRTVDTAERERLFEQEKAMRQLSMILGARIAAFPKD